MDAWANISHYLDYKSDTDIPRELKRDFYALSGLFYVADAHFELFFKSRREVVKRLETSDFLPTQEINMDSLKAFLVKYFPYRKHSSDLIDISILVKELLSNGYTSIGELENALDNSKDAFIAYERDCKGEFSDQGAIRISLDLYDENWRRYRQGGASKSLTKKYKKLCKTRKN